MVQNLTEGRPLKLLFFFALPMVAGNLFQQLYNMVDTMVVGKFVGEDAVAAVGSSFPIVFLSVAVASGLSMGSNVVVSQLFGAGRIHEMKSTISTAIISLSVLGLIIMALGTVLAGPLLQLLGTDPDIMADSRLYLQIYFGGAVFLFLYNTLNGIYNAQGDSRTPLLFLMISSLTNIVLDLVFVIQFHMGVAGVAWATLIAQGMCAVCSLLVLIRRLKRMPCEPGRQGEKIPLFHLLAVKRIARIGLPSMLQQSLRPEHRGRQVRAGEGGAEGLPLYGGGVLPDHHRADLPVRQPAAGSVPGPGGGRHGGLHLQLHGQPVLPGGHRLRPGLPHPPGRQRHLVVHPRRLGHRRGGLPVPGEERPVDAQGGGRPVRTVPF